MIDDKHILDLFVNNNGKIISTRINSKNVTKYSEECEYLKHRFPNDDFISYTYVVQRIRDGIEVLPTCKNCGKKLYNYNATWCSTHCQLTDKEFVKTRTENLNYIEINDKRKETLLSKYGVTSGFCIPNCQKSSHSKQARTKASISYKNTCNERYGVDNWFQTKNGVECSHTNEVNTKRVISSKRTFNSKYGVDCSLQLDDVRNKIPYDEIKQKIKITMVNKYGVMNPMQLPNVKQHFNDIKDNIVAKRIETQRKNGTFNTSKTELDSLTLLKQCFSDIKTQYKSEQYPFSCDFYIPSLNLYIECNYHWTHGGHPYSENNVQDKQQLLTWTNKNTTFYRNAIQTWTVRDVNKRNTAKQNNLNYLEFWNINELKNWLKQYEI